MDACIKQIENLLDSGNYRESLEKLKEYTGARGSSDVTAILEGEALMALGQLEEARRCMEKGLSYNSRNYELYFMLGGYYEKSGKAACAYLCYQYALFYCKDGNDRNILEDNMESVQRYGWGSVPKVAVIIKAGESLEWLKICLKSLRLHNPEDSFEIMVAVSRETEDMNQWLKGQEDITLVKKGERKEGDVYNLCIDAAQKDSDILLLYDYTILLEHSLFNLRLALYEEDTRGAAGSVNYMREPMSADTDKTGIKQFSDYARRYNIPGENYHEPVIQLRGSAMLLRREAVKQCGWLDSGLLDDTYQRADLCFRLIQGGWSTVECEDSLVLLAEEDNRQAEEAKDRFYRKWKINLGYSCFARKEMLEYVDTEEEDFCALEIGCSCGGTLLALKHRYPHCRLYGIELDPGPASIAGHIAQVVQANVEEPLQYPPGYFSYIIIGDVLEHLHQPEKVLEQLKTYLKADGKLIISVPNVMHISVVRSLLNGNWTYQDAGILDRTHVRFFTKYEVIRMLERTGYQIRRMKQTVIPVSQEEESLIKNLVQLGHAQEDMYQAYQYIAVAELFSALKQ